MHGCLFLPAQSSDTHVAQLQHALAELQRLLGWAAEAIGCKLLSHFKSVMYLYPDFKWYKPHLDICFNLTLAFLIYFLFYLEHLLYQLQLCSSAPCKTPWKPSVSLPALRTVLKATPHTKSLTRCNALAEMTAADFPWSWLEATT